ncbi:MAG: 3-coathanger stack domain-containing protein [Bacteroidota bacterium]
MKSLLTLFAILSFSISIQAQSYGVGFDVPLASAGGGWEASGNPLWTTTSEATPTISGINTTPRQGSGFAFVERAGSSTGATIVYLESPCFDLTNTVTRVEFFHQILGAVTNFRLEVSFDDGATYNQTVLTVPNGTYTDWERQNTTGLNISGSVRFRFVVEMSGGSNTIVALDQLQFFGAMQNDAMACPNVLPDCFENLTINDATLSNDFYRAANTLSSNASIASNDNVTFTAGNTIILTEGFTAGNTTFTARIEDCNGTEIALLENITRTNPSITIEEVDYFDRFGNGYTRNELEEGFTNQGISCEVGVFQLQFDDTVTEGERNITCEVFSYLDSLIISSADAGTINIDIRKDSLRDETLANATPFWEIIGCGITNSVIEKLLIGAEPDIIGFTHGIIVINADFEDQFYTQLAPPDETDDDLIHFYTVMLHEALHILGFASLIDEDSTPIDIQTDNGIIEGQTFSRYDQYLYSLTESDFLLDPIGGVCCDEHTYQLDSLPKADCNTQFRYDNQKIASVNGGANANRRNLLSHFNIDCDNDVSNYVMHPTLGRIGSNSDRAIRDRITCEELQTLQLIGYKLNSTLLGSCSIDPNDDQCTVAATTDTYVFELENNELDTSIFIRDSSNAILANDFSSVDTFAFSIDTSFVLSADGDTLFIVIQGNQVNLSTISSGSYQIPYTISACNGDRCDDGVIRIIINSCVREEGECNLVSCYGDFESFESREELRALLAGQFGNFDGFSFTTPFSSASPGLRMPRNIAESATYLLFECSNGTTYNSREDDLDQGTILALETGFFGNFRSIEGLVMPLNDCILPLNEGSVSLKSFIPSPCLALDSFQIRIDFASSFPESGSIIYEEPNYILASYFIDIESSELTNPIFQTYTVNFENTTDEEWDHMFISAIYQGSEFKLGSVAIDDVEVIVDKQIQVNSSLDEKQLCAEGEFLINYEITNPYCGVSDSIPLELIVPNSLTKGMNGAFGASNSIVLAPLAPKETRFVQVELEANEQAMIGDEVNVILKVEPDACYIPTFDTVKVSFIDSPLTSLTKSFAVSNDTFEFTIEVCNSLNDTLPEVQIIDELPPTFQITESNGFQFTSTLSGNFMLLDTLILPASGGMETCLTVSYKAMSTTNFCPDRYTAAASIPNSNCSIVRDFVDLEDPALPVLTASFTDTVDCATGIATFMSAATASGISHFWNFGDGLTSMLADPTHTYLNFGTYEVRHEVSNQCGTVEEIMMVTYEPCPNVFNCSCTNPTFLGNPPDGITNISQTNLPLNYDNTNACLQIGGTIIIDTTFTINNGTVIFEPDAQIIVRDNRTFNINDATLQSCDNFMWRGVEVEEGGNINLINANISDATNAITLNQNAIFNIRDCVFDRNRVGIQVRETPLKNALDNNTFSCSDTLNNGRWGLAGIRVDDGFFIIGQVGTTPELNTFEDTYYGVVSTDALALISNTTFRNLRFEENVRRLDASNGVAVLGRRGGRVEVNNCDILNAHEAVRIRACATFIGSNTITNVDSAITVNTIRQFEKVDVIGNTIKAGLRGVAFEGFSVPASATIDRNDIDVNFFRYTYVDNDDFGPEPIGIGIYLNEFATDEYVSILDNTIRMQTGNFTVDPLTFGIDCRSSEGVDIARNNIFSVGDTITGGGAAFGIYFEEVENILISDCTFRDSLTASDAIVAETATNVSYCCNKFQMTGEALYFSGMSEGTKMNLNDIGMPSDTADSGVICTDGTILGVQVYEVPGAFERRHRGNKWLSDFYREYGAVHEGTEGEADASRFVVPNQSFPLYPQAAGIDEVDPDNLFEVSSAVNRQVDTCSQNLECAFRAAPMQLIENARQIASRAAFTTSPYSEMLNWESNQYLLKLLRNNPSFLNRFAEIDAANSRWNGTDLEALVNVKNSYRIGNTISRLSSELSSQQEELQLLQEVLEQSYIDLQVTNDTDERAAILSDIRTTIGSIDIKRNELQSQKANLLRTIENRLQSIAIQNSQISTTNILAANEQIVNAINLQYLTIADLKLSATQTDLLFSVANQCPKLGGRYVYKARTLYNILVADIKFNDEELCQNNKTIEERTVESQLITSPSLSVFPNPTYNSFNLSIENINIESEYQINLYDLTGRLIQTVHLDERATLVNDLESGVYLCSLIENGVQIDIQKVIVL